MSQPFLGQIQPFGFGFAPKGWALCNGQIMSISQSTALFSLLGTMYGGNGQTTFALPNLQSRVPMHSGSFVGNSYSQGEEAGEEQVSLDISAMPLHSHTFMGTSANANAAIPSVGIVLGQIHQPSGATPDFYYAPDTTPQSLNSGSLSAFGGNVPHSNLQPYLTINWCIAMTGIYPSRN